MSMQKVKVRGQRLRSQRSQPKLTVSGLQLHFEFTYDDEILRMAWRCLGEMLYNFSRSSVKFQGHTASNLTQIWYFRTVTPVWIHQWPQKDAQSLKRHRRGALCFSRSSVKFQGDAALKSVEFDPDWSFPDCNSSLNSPMATKWCIRL